MNSVVPSSHPTTGPLSRRLTAAVTVALLAISGALLPAETAHADTVTVTNRAQLTAAVSAPCGGATAADPRVIVVANHFGSTYDPAVLYVSCHVRVDLGGKTMSSGAIALRDGTSMHLMSSAPGGTLNAYASFSNEDHAGIRTSQAVLTIDGVRVFAAGSHLGAGIGGGGIQGYGHRSGESGGTVRIVGGARVEATGGERGAGIGGGAGLAGGRGIGGSGDGGVGSGGPGPNLTISGVGTHVVASGTYGAGIGGGNGAGVNSSADGGRGGLGGTVTISDGANVRAQSYRGAGIGGGTGTGYGLTYSGRGGSLVVADATLTAVSALGAAIGSGDSSERGAHGGTLEVRAGGKVTAVADGSGSGFGTGRHGANDDSESMRLTVEEGGSLDVWSTSQSGLRIGRGEATINGAVNVSSSTLTVDSNRFTIGSTGRITGPTATLNGSGTIVNKGTILMRAVTGVGVTHNNFLTRFHPSVGATTDVRIYAPTFADANATMPGVASGNGWNSAAAGTGAWFALSTPLTPTLMSEPVWATNTGATPIHVWETTAPADAVTVRLTAPAAVTAGELFPVEAELRDLVTDEVIATTSSFTIRVDPDRLSAVGGTLRAESAGTSTITASISYLGQVRERSVPLVVTPGPPVRALLTPLTAVVEVDETVTFGASGFDAYDNPTTLVGVLSSSEPGDEIDDYEVTFRGSGARSITLSVGGVAMANADVQVHDDVTRYELRVQAEDTAVAGVPFEISTTLIDRLTDVAVTAPYTVAVTTDTHATPFATGMHTELTTGPLTVTGTAIFGGHSYVDTFNLEVVAGPVETLALTPSLTNIYRGESVTFTVTGLDAHGNSVDTSAAALENTTSGTGASVVRVLSFDTLGDATVRASLGAASVDAVVRVRPDPARTVIELLDGPGGSTAGQSMPLRVAVKDSVTDEVYPLDVNDVVWSSTSGSLIDGRDETGVETLAGSHVQRASVDFWGVQLEATRAWTVVAADPARLFLSPTSIDTLDGRIHAFGTRATDVYGNAVPTTGLTLASTHAADTVNGLNVTFRGAGTRQVLASLAGATMTAEVRVASPPRTGGVPPALELPIAEPSGEPDAEPGSATPGNGGDGGATDGPAASDRGAADDEAVSDDAVAASDAAPAWWLWILVVIGAAVLAAALAFALLRRSRAI